MTFTDDDLKRLKEMLEPGIKGHPDTLAREVEEFFRFKADALLARLEAAEACAEQLHWHNEALGCIQDGLSLERLNKRAQGALDTWRKAAGK